MKKITKRLIVVILSLTIFIIISFLWSQSFKTCINPNLRNEIIEYCKKNNLCESYCILIDYSIYSGKDRLFIVDLNNNEILYSTLCAHGIGKDFDCIIKPKFSNEVGSNLSSLGHFKLGISRKTSQYNLNAIELHGLDSTNSNAYARGILIHDGLPNIKIVGLPCLPLSQGCFTVTDETFKVISNLKNDANKPVLLYSSDKSIF